MVFRFQIDPSTFVIIFVLSTASAWRNFDLIFTDIKCFSNTDFLVNLTCTLDTSRIPMINIEGVLLRDVTDLRMTFEVDLERSANENVNLIKIRNMDGCKLMSDNNTSQPLLKIYKDVLRKAGPVPDGCPIPRGFHYKYQNLTIKPEYLPPYVPETTFKVAVVFSEGPIEFWDAKVSGKVRNKKNQKGVFI